MTANHTRLLALLSAIVAAAALRLVPHPPNFTPIGAMALFSGAYLGRRGARLRRAAGGVAAERPRARLLSRHGDGLFQRRADRRDRLAGAAARFAAPRRRRRDCRARSCSSSSPTSACGCSAASIRARWRASKPATSPPFRSSRTRLPATCSMPALLFGGFALRRAAAAALRAGPRSAAPSVATLAASL